MLIIISYTINRNIYTQKHCKGTWILKYLVTTLLFGFNIRYISKHTYWQTIKQIHIVCGIKVFSQIEYYMTC